VRTLRTQFEYIWTLAYTPDGQYLAVGGRNSRTLHTLVLYDVQTGEPCRWFKDHLKPVRSICFHPTEPLIVSGGFDGWIHVRNYLTGDEVAKYLAIREGYIERVVFLADGKHVLLSGGSPDGKTLELAGMVVWNFTNGKEAARWETEELVGLVCMQVSPDGQWIVTGGKREGVRLWKMPPLLAK
jgi:coatomer protein complex subunit alpha (xenin)